jgi:hypothetical protein
MAAQDYEQVTYNSPSGAQMGQSATEKIGFYGAVPIVQRASSAQASSLAVTSASFGASQSALLAEVANTLTALGLWKGAA